MRGSKVKQEQIDNAIEIAAYLQNEVEALKYVIEDVPHRANPPEGYSIFKLIMLIDHAQSSFYQPIIEEALQAEKSIRLQNFVHYTVTFDTKKTEDEDIQKVLSQLANHRAVFINRLRQISLTNWNKAIYDNDQEILLIHLIEIMNHSDQIYLKKITNLVKAFQDEKIAQRGLNQRKQQINLKS